MKFKLIKFFMLSFLILITNASSEDLTIENQILSLRNLIKDSEVNKWQIYRTEKSDKIEISDSQDTLMIKRYDSPNIKGISTKESFQEIKLSNLGLSLKWFSKAKITLNANWNTYWAYDSKGQLFYITQINPNSTNPLESDLQGIITSIDGLLPNLVNQQLVDSICLDLKKFNGQEMLSCSSAPELNNSHIEYMILTLFTLLSLALFYRKRKRS
jgi:hypothetical protein